ncbi:MAG: RNA pyrophosphohydrolase [Alphaproteobacteria bacterium]|nr:RNA pyrophosphohydrolase [Alphaproteobacteria bacterium]
MLDGMCVELGNEYRKGVGIMLINDEGKVFVAQRIDTPGAWQMPQGGVDNGEENNLHATVMRELEEEIGTNKAEIIAESDEWFSYDLPVDVAKSIWNGKYRGQSQKWFLLRYKGTDEDINIETEIPEFNDWKWMNFDDLLDTIVDFKKDIYKQITDHFRPMLP